MSLYDCPAIPVSFDVLRVEIDGRRNSLKPIAATDCAEQAEAVRQHLQHQAEQAGTTAVNYVIRRPSSKQAPARLSRCQIENLYKTESFYCGYDQAAKV